MIVSSPPSLNVPDDVVSRALLDTPGLSPETTARLAKGLAHSARAAIVQRLADGRARIASDIVRESGLSQSAVSEHLRVLRDAGILSTRKDGPRVWYGLRADVLRQFAHALEDLTDD